jgi:myb proto-oncogene protein
MDNRNVNQCIHRYRRIKNLHGCKGKWTPAEDTMVLKLLAEHGFNWTRISKEVKRKTGKQIRERYVNHLDPDIKRGEWTEE